MTELYESNPHDVVPLMSGYTHGNIVVSASGEYENYHAWHAFDRSVATKNNIWAVCASTGWLKVYIELPVNWNVTSYIIASMPDDGVPYEMMPRNWTLEGSNDDVNWTVLDTQTEQYWGYDMFMEYPISSPGDYRWYRLNISANNYSYYTAIGEFNLRGDSVFFQPPPAIINASGTLAAFIPSTLTVSERDGIIAAIRALTLGEFVDIRLQITAFESIVENGTMKYMQVVIPGMTYAGDIADRAGGLLSVYMVRSGVVTEIGSLPISGISIDEGALNQSITLYARLSEI
jgi:hypothetical protein